MNAEQQGSAGDEAARLLDAVGRRVGKALVSGAIGRGGGGRTGDVWSDAVSEREHSPPCTACPICRMMAASREVGPDVVDHLTAAGGSLIAAARDALNAYDRQRTKARRNPDVEHINLD